MPVETLLRSLSPALQSKRDVSPVVHGRPVAASEKGVPAGEPEGGGMLQEFVNALIWPLKPGRVKVETNFTGVKAE
jgi:hypothetical protein